MTEVLLAVRRRRRFHTREFKAMVVESCYVEGVSLSAVAIAHGLNPNMVRRWVTDFETGVKDLPILNKDRLFALIAAGGGRSEQLQVVSPLVHVAEPTNCSDSKECKSTTHDDCSDCWRALKIDPGGQNWMRADTRGNEVTENLQRST